MFESVPGNSEKTLPFIMTWNRAPMKYLLDSDAVNIFYDDRREKGFRGYLYKDKTKDEQI